MSNDIQDASDRLSEALAAQTRSIEGLTSAIRGQRRTGRLVLALVILNIAGVCGAFATIKQNDNASKERSRVAVEQRETQLQILREIRAQQK